MSLRTNLSYLLFPFTMWYAIGVSVRNMLYSLGLKKQHAPHVTTIGVGNLSTGGTGKTPHVEYLLDLLQPHHRMAMLSRGYKRKSKGYVVDDGSHNPRLLGDEPAMIARKHEGVKVAVCENRLHGVAQLTKDEEAPQVVVLDDVYQHRRIKPSINILLTEYSHPYFSDRILPYGNLREFRSASNRASIVVVTKCPTRLNPIERHNIEHDLRLQRYQKVFFSYFAYADLLTLQGERASVDLKPSTHALVVTGIAHPQPLLAELGKRCKVHHLGFADHHNYSARDIARIKQAFEAIASDNKLIITTEKDAERLRGLADDLPVYVQPVRVAFHADEGNNFDQLILSSVAENISFLGKLNIWAGRDL